MDFGFALSASFDTLMDSEMIHQIRGRDVRVYAQVLGQLTQLFPEALRLCNYVYVAKPYGPVLGWRNVASTCIRLDQPAPLGRNKPKTPFPTWRLTPLRASVPSE